jgi:dystrophin
MSDLMSSLAEYNEVRFSAYRTALKLRGLQKELKRKLTHIITTLMSDAFHLCWLIILIHTNYFTVDRLPLKTVVETFDSLGLRGHNDRLLDVPDMMSTMHTLYNLCSSQLQSQPTTSGKNAPPAEAPVSISYISDMAINWLLNVYDSQRTGQIRNLSFKTGVVLLCKGPMEDKFRCKNDSRNCRALLLFVWCSY